MAPAQQPQRAGRAAGVVKPARGNATVYATVYGSWNSVVPVGHEIVRIDLAPSADGGGRGPPPGSPPTSAPPSIAFHPDGDLFYATFGGNGRLHVIQAE